MENKSKKLFFESSKKTKTTFLVALAALAALMLLILPSQSESSGTDDPDSGCDVTQYCQMLEQKAEELILGLDGVKECRVFVTLETGYCYTYATDQSVKESFFENGATSQKETQKTVVFHNGDGKAVLLRQEMPKISGVAVVCKGAGYDVQYRIISLVCALFDVSSNRISVQS